jgi:hypothetical protein
MDVMITVGKVRAPSAGRRLGAPNMYWPHIWWLNHAVKREVDCSKAESLFYNIFSSEIEIYER